LKAKIAALNEDVDVFRDNFGDDLANFLDTVLTFLGIFRFRASDFRAECDIRVQKSRCDTPIDRSKA
jgi:hypothetical protein